ncbi:MAG: hypothetical protein UZ11_BCD004001431 [Bacteroidetes bacterium OLB11]|nr:MAG: hypothetical protein UZ11_BCD004001431 [Bacteroidetes bacterium OLB11]
MQVDSLGEEAVKIHFFVKKNELNNNIVKNIFFILNVKYFTNLIFFLLKIIIITRRMSNCFRLKSISFIFHKLLISIF